jgi:hypothetical protein
MKSPITPAPIRLVLVAAVFNTRPTPTRTAILQRCAICGEFWNEGCSFCSPESERLIVTGGASR